MTKSSKKAIAITLIVVVLLSPCLFIAYLFFPQYGRTDERRDMTALQRELLATETGGRKKTKCVT